MEASASHVTAANVGDHPTPLGRLRDMLEVDRIDLAVVFGYTLLVGTLTLSIPLAAQALVNTIAAGVFIQPLVILTALLLGIQLFVGVVRLLKLSLVEALQQRIFARVALHLARHVMRIRHEVFSNEYAPELVNRFFDVLTVQTSLAKLLLDGPTALLQIAVGLALMAVYSPLLLAFDLFVMVFGLFWVAVLGHGGLATSIRESIQKYRVSEWLEELGRCNTNLKVNGRPSHFVARADDLVVDYIEARRAHFGVTWRQAFGIYLFQAIGFAGVLAIGGWLVIERKLTLGQLVAAELVVASVLGATEKLARLAEDLYDLLTGLDKIGHVTDLPEEREGGATVECRERGATVAVRGLRFAYPGHSETLAGVDLKIQPGEHLSLVGTSGSGKSTLLGVLCGLYTPLSGSVEINGIDVRSADLSSLRKLVALVGRSPDIFDGTIEENIVVGRSWVGSEAIRRAIEIVRLDTDLARLPRGLATPLVAEGGNLSRGQVQRLLIARAIVGRPQLLILDEAFTGIDYWMRLSICAEICRRSHQWTVVNVAHDPELVLRSDRVVVLCEGRVMEDGTPLDLIRDDRSELSRLFPRSVHASSPPTGVA